MAKLNVSQMRRDIDSEINRAKEAEQSITGRVERVSETVSSINRVVETNTSNIATISTIATEASTTANRADSTSSQAKTTADKIDGMFSGNALKVENGGTGRSNLNEHVNDIVNAGKFPSSKTIWQFSEKDYGSHDTYSRSNGAYWHGWYFSKVKKGGSYSDYFEFGQEVNQSEGNPSIIRFKKAGSYRICMQITFKGSSGQRGVGIFGGSSSMTDDETYQTEIASNFCYGYSENAVTATINSIHAVNEGDSFSLKVLQYDSAIYLGMMHSRVIIEYLGE